MLYLIMVIIFQLDQKIYFYPFLLVAHVGFLF
jgi:hypothetical protein